MRITVETIVPTFIAKLVIAACLCLLLMACGQDETETGHGVDEPGNKIVLRGQSGVTIDGRQIATAPSIELHNCDSITLINCDLNSVVAGGCHDLRIVNCYIHNSTYEGVYLDDCVGVLVQGNRFERVKTGVLAHRSRGVRVIGNFCKDVLGPIPGGQLVQFDKVTGEGNRIANNYTINAFDTSQPEDVISLYQSHGTPESPILIENNYLTGDPTRGSAGKSDSGSGIMLGDNGGSWQLCRNNTLLSPGQVGIGVACGEDIVVENNLILGQQSDVANVGLYAWNQYEDQPAGRVTFRGNTVAWVNNAGKDNPFWEGGGFTRIIEQNNSFGGSSLLESIQAPEPPSTAPQPPIPFKASDDAR